MANRWVSEMEEIAETFSAHGGFDKDIYIGAASLYKSVSEETPLSEKPDRLTKGGNLEEIISLVLKGMTDKKKNLERQEKALIDRSEKTEMKKRETRTLDFDDLQDKLVLEDMKPLERTMS